MFFNFHLFEPSQENLSPPPLHQLRLPHFLKKFLKIFATTPPCLSPTPLRLLRLFGTQEKDT